MFKSFKKIVSVVAALGLLATSYVTVLAAPTTVFNWNVNDMTLPPNNCRLVENGSAVSPINYSTGIFGKSSTDASVSVGAYSNDSYFDFAQSGSNSIWYSEEGYGAGSTVVCSVNFAFENEGQVPNLQIAGTKTSGTGTANLYANGVSGLYIALNNLPQIDAKKWHNLSIAIKINSADNTVASDVTMWIDGTEVGSGTVMPSAALGHMFYLLRVKNPSKDGLNTMYLDDAKVDIYPPSETIDITNKVGTVSIPLPYTTTLANNMSISYPTNVYNKGANDISLQLTPAKTSSLVQLQDIAMAYSVSEEESVVISFKTAFDSFTTGHDLFMTLLPTENGAGFRDSNSVAQNYGVDFSNGNVTFYGIDTGYTLQTGRWYDVKVVYDVVTQSSVKISLYINNQKLASGVFTPTRSGVFTSVYAVRFTSGAIGNSVYLDDIDLQISEYVPEVSEPSVSATATNQTQGDVNYMTWDAEPENVEAEEITDCGFAFINDEEITNGNPIVWQESTKRDNGTFGAAIAQDPNATGSSIYAIPYIAGQGFAKLGTAVRSIFNTIGNE